MASQLPSFSIVVRGRENMSSQGELNTLFVGYGIHQAWIFTILFGGFFSGSTVSGMGLFDIRITPLVLAFHVAYTVMLLFVAHTDQKFLRLYTARKLLVVAAVISSLGSCALGLAVSAGAPTVLIIALGVLIGIGATFLTVSWGVSFARESSTTIVFNSAISIFVALGIYILVCFVIPDPCKAAAASILPLLELPLIWGRTPVSYAVRSAVPIFNPLPVNKLLFSLKLLPSIILFGFVLNAFMTSSLGVILPFEDPTTWLLTLFIGGFLTLVLVSGSFSLSTDESWDFLFRPLIPVLSICLVFTGMVAPDALVPCTLVITGFMCCKALLWTLFGQMAQELRLSPIYIFGVGQGGIAIGALLEFSLVGGSHPLINVLPFGQENVIVVLLVCMATAYALLPRMRDIKRTIISTSDGMENAVAHFNRHVERLAVAQQIEDIAAPVAPVAPTSDEPASSLQQPAVASSQPVHDVAVLEDGEGRAVDTAPLQNAQNESDEGERRVRAGRFRLQCEAVSNRYLLSRRETEVMFMLAKGYNAERIQDALFISRSTVKTHIAHIYRKLDIHSQQELLAMVEAERDNIQGDAG